MLKIDLNPKIPAIDTDMPKYKITDRIKYAFWVLIRGIPFVAISKDNIVVEGLNFYGIPLIINKKHCMIKHNYFCGIEQLGRKQLI